MVASVAFGLTACGDSDSAAALPNILLIVAADFGYSDLGACGSEISTPNLDTLAAEGRLLLNHHTPPARGYEKSYVLLPRRTLSAPEGIGHRPGRSRVSTRGQRSQGSERLFTGRLGIESNYPPTGGRGDCVEDG